MTFAAPPLPPPPPPTAQTVPTSQATPAIQPTTLAQAKLYRKVSPSQYVQFQFNPKTIRVSHGASLKELGVKKSKTNDSQQAVSGSGADSNLTTQQALEKLGMTSLKISDIVFDGAKVLEYCGRLLLWTYPYEIRGGAISSGQAVPLALEPLVFTWGNFQLGAGTALGSKIPVIATKVDVAYERFDASGTPIRATVGLDLQIQADNPLKQNPTSGSLPGRGGHTMVSGEALPGIAVAEYGSPGHWRALAEANQIDDPLRVGPGSVLRLPNRADLASTGAA